jgi:hypothetical protein
MKVKQFQELYFITQSKDVDIDKSVKMVGVMTGLTPDKVDLLSMEKFNKYCKKIQREFSVFDKNLLSSAPIKLVKTNGRTYQIRYDIKNIDAAMYVEVATWGTDVITNLHKIMASICVPVKFSFTKMKWVPYEIDHQSKATDMEGINFEAAYHAAVFFYTLYRVSMQIIQPYLIQKLTAKGKRAEEAEAILNGSLQILDGFITPNWSLSLRGFLLNRYGS